MAVVHVGLDASDYGAQPLPLASPPAQLQVSYEQELSLGHDSHQEFEIYVLL